MIILGEVQGTKTKRQFEEKRTAISGASYFDIILTMSFFFTFARIFLRMREHGVHFINMWVSK